MEIVELLLFFIIIISLIMWRNADLNIIKIWKQKEEEKLKNKDHKILKESRKLKELVTTQVHFRQDLRDRQDYYGFGIFNNAQASWKARDFSGHFYTTQERDKDLGQGLPEDGRNG